MSVNSGNAPAWLFSFLDLAFLILIALLHTADYAEDPAPELASIELPEIQRSSTAPAEFDAAEQWHVRVYPRRLPEDRATFSLVASRPEPDAREPGEPLRVAPDELQQALARLRDRSVAKPVLAPHRDSRSEDFLTALGFVQEVWPEAHVSAVRPRVATPSVSAAPVPANASLEMSAGRTAGLP